MRVAAVCAAGLAVVLLAAGLASAGPERAGAPGRPPAREARVPFTITLEPIFPAGTFTESLGLNHSGVAGDNRLFVVEKGGVIRIAEGGTVRPAPFLDISALVSQGSEQGLLGLAFHPNYAANGYAYVYYTALNYDLVLVRYTRSAGDPNRLDPATRAEILTIPHPDNDFHNGGQLAFGPDGYLYLAPGDPADYAQNRNALLGKVLRIDLNAPAPTPYVIPTTNPFYGDPAARGEVWSWGLRNPWRFSFDRQTGDLYIADAGEANWEEVDFEPAGSPGGVNYGWPLWEGRHCYEPPVSCTPTPGATPFYPWATPVAEYSSATFEECTIIGGYVYRGPGSPDLAGIYFFADLCSGRIWGLEHSGGVWTMSELLDTAIPISSFGEDVAGEQYVVGIEGSIWRIRGTAAGTPTPTATATAPAPTATRTATPTGTTTPPAPAWRVVLPLQLRQ
jgi:glucose/arabinose dehydrogenase